VDNEYYPGDPRYVMGLFLLVTEKNTHCALLTDLLIYARDMNR